MVACVEEDTVHLARSHCVLGRYVQDPIRVDIEEHRRYPIEMALLEDQGPTEPTHEQIARVAEGHQNH